MGFKSAVVSVGTTDTDIFEMGAGLEGAVVLGVGNTMAGAITYTIKFYKQSLGTTTTIVSSKSHAANDFQKVPVPIAMEAGDKIIMSAASAGLRAFGTITDSSATTVSGAWNPRGEYSAVATYAKRDVVYVPDDGVSYISLQDGNTGNTPSSQPAYWMVNANRGADGDAGTPASESTAGVVELATAAEVVTGTDTARAVTPAGAAAVYSRLHPLNRTVSGTTDTLAATDNGKILYTTNGSAVTITVPPDIFAVDDMLVVIQEGAGKVSFAEGSGVTVNSAGDYLSIAARYGSATLIARGSNTFDLIGLLAA
jgi:hypothetical protein